MFFGYDISIGIPYYKSEAIVMLQKKNSVQSKIMLIISIATAITAIAATVTTILLVKEKKRKEKEEKELDDYLDGAIQ